MCEQKHLTVVVVPVVAAVAVAVVVVVVVEDIGVGAQSTLGGTKFLPENYVLKISKMPEFYIILAQKIIKIP